MFFEQLSEISNIATKSGCSIFVVPKNTEVEIRSAWLLRPETKTKITIEQVREVLEKFVTKQTQPQLVLIRPADLLTEEAANAILKNLEEPQENVHFLLVTDDLSKLLKTVVSRASVYVWRGGITPINQIAADKKIKDLAKRFLVARPNELVDLAEEVAKKKDSVRVYALEILGTAIEMAYKTYFLTGKKAFLDKLPKFLTAYENISQNGHVKLHLVADLI